MIVVFELMGNDVCGGHEDFDHWTKPDEFEADIRERLAELDAKLPVGSHVIVLGLATGTILWDSLHDRTHPLGVTYETFYNYLNCLDTSPCWGWMNSNETVRNAT